jgi:hypothetical protein
LTAFGLVIEFIEHLQIVNTINTNNYNTLANSCSRILTTAQFVFTSGFLVTDPNNVLCLRSYWLTNISQLTKFKVKVTLRLMVSQSVSQSVSLGVEPHLGPMARY